MVKIIQNVPAGRWADLDEVCQHFSSCWMVQRISPVKSCTLTVVAT